MGHDEAAAATQKSEKTPSPPKDQPALYPYPDWSTMQAYYGPGVVPPPYFGPAIAPGHAPRPYMWGPQPLMPPPFGTPYAAMYPHGGGYSHPLVHLMANPLNTEPAKSANTKDKSPNKKLKELDGLAVSIGNGNSEKASGDNSAEGSSDGNELKVNKTPRKRGSEEGPGSDAETSGSAKMSLEDVSAPTDIPGKPAISPNPCFPSPGMNPNAASIGNVKAIGTPIPPSAGALVPCRNGVATELWTKDERELKRERRKQSNRESARRSRLRKQAETEELAMKVESLIAENKTLRSEISRLAESSEKLRLENSALMGKLKSTVPNQAEEVSLEKMSVASPLVVENFLSMIDNTNTSSISGHGEHNEPKLRQLLGSSQATDAVAAS